MSLPKNIIIKYPYLEVDSILVSYRGSITYGTYRPSKEENSIDDKDVMAIVIPSIDNYFGLKEWGSKGTKEHFIGEWDIVSYEFKKFISLLSKCNPNTLFLLWLNDEYFIKKTEIGQRIIDNRNLFRSKLAYNSFSGYAYSQYKRIDNAKFNGFLGQKRKKLVEKFGFDTKYCSHSIRLLRQGIEFLNDGELYVLREDATQLLDIKNGLWSREQVEKEFKRLQERLDNAYDNCRLPSKPDYEGINKLCVDLLWDYFHYEE